MPCHAIHPQIDPSRLPNLKLRINEPHLTDGVKKIWNRSINLPEGREAVSPLQHLDDHAHLLSTHFTSSNFTGCHEQIIRYEYLQPRTTLCRTYCSYNPRQRTTRCSLDIEGAYFQTRISPYEDEPLFHRFSSQFTSSSITTHYRIGLEPRCFGPTVMRKEHV